MTRKKSNQVVKIILANLAFVAVGVLVLELIFGNWIKSDNLNRLNIVRSRTVQFAIGNLYESNSETATYTRDKHGLRGSFDNPGEIDILTVGGSTTDQRYVSDGETWQDVMQQEFQKAGRKVVVANAGVDGQSSYGHIKNFDWWFPHIPDLRPKFILFYVGNNDFYKDEGYGEDALVLERKPSLVQSIKDKSATYHVLRTAKGVYTARVKHHIGHEATDFDALEWTAEPLASDYETLMRGRLKEYTERLSILADRTKAMGAEAVFVTQPTYRYKRIDGTLYGITESFLYDDVPINGVDYYHMMRLLDDAMLAVCEAKGAHYIDLSRNVEWDVSDFYDHAHMTPKGARKVGEYLFKMLSATL